MRKVVLEKINERVLPSVKACRDGTLLKKNSDRYFTDSYQKLLGEAILYIDDKKLIPWKAMPPFPGGVERDQWHELDESLI